VEGVVKSQRYLTSGFMTHESDRNEDAPWGMIFGGKSGHGSKVDLRNTVTREVSYQSAKFSGLRTNIGDTITHYSPIGGGYGAPLDRDPRKVLDDVLDGFITVGHARDDCGVVLIEVDDGYGWALNREATRKLRTEMAQALRLKKIQLRHDAMTGGFQWPLRRMMTEQVCNPFVPTGRSVSQKRA
jgi:N-methylhydantoinase B